MEQVSPSESGVDPQLGCASRDWGLEQFGLTWFLAWYYSIFFDFISMLHGSRSRKHTVLLYHTLRGCTLRGSWVELCVEEYLF